MSWVLNTLAAAAGIAGLSAAASVLVVAGGARSTEAGSFVLSGEPVVRVAIGVTPADPPLLPPPPAATAGSPAPIAIAAVSAPDGADSADAAPGRDDGVYREPARVTAPVRLRAVGSMDAEVLATVPVGTAVDVIGSRNGWMRVEVPVLGRSGWIHHRYVLFTPKSADG